MQEFPSNLSYKFPNSIKGNDSSKSISGILKKYPISAHCGKSMWRYIKRLGWKFNHKALTYKVFWSSHEQKNPYTMLTPQIAAQKGASRWKFCPASMKIFEAFPRWLISIQINSTNEWFLHKQLTYPDTQGQSANPQEYLYKL